MDGDEHNALLDFEEQYSGQFYGEISIPVPVRKTDSEPSPEQLARADSTVDDNVQASNDNQDTREPVAGLDDASSKENDVICDSTEHLVTISRETEPAEVNESRTDGAQEHLATSVSCEPAEQGESSVAIFEIGSGEAESPERVVLSDSEIMEFYNREEEQFENEIMNVVTPPPSNRRVCRKRGLSPSPTREHVGLAHLDHLVGLMEQLAQLQEENRGLKRKCVYLEDTRLLLHLQNKQLLSRDTRRDSRTRGPRLRMTVHSLKASKINVNYASEDSSEEDDPLMVESRGGRQLKMSQRSQSVGSINVIDMESSPCKSDKQEKCKEGGGLEKMFSRSVLNSKWQRVKKVFGGKPEPVVKSEAYTATAEQVMRANTKHVTSKHSVSRPLISSKSYDYGVLAEPYFDDGMYGYSVAGTSVDVPPPSPGSVNSDTPIPSVVTDGDPYEGSQTPAADSGLDLEVHGSSMGSSLFGEEGEGRPSAHSPRPGSDEERRLSHQFLTVGSSMKRRQSSPTLIMQEEALKHAHKLQAPPSRSPRLTRSSSFRTEDSPSSPTNDTPTPQSPTNENATHRGLQKNERSSRSAWGRVKDIIHTRKDSLKRRNGRSHSAGDALPDGSMSDGEYILGGDYDFENWEPDSPTAYNSSPRKSRSRKTSAYSQPTSPERGRTNGASHQGDRQKDPLRATMSSPLEASAFQGSVSEDFNKKMQEWEEKKRRGTTKGGSFSVEVEHDQEGKNKFSKEFIRKMEEWERIKGLDKNQNSGQSAAAEGRDIGSQSPTYEEMQQHQLSESFTQTVKEWERVKTQRLKDTSGSSIDINTGSGLKRAGTDKRISRKKDRSKSSDRERDRSRSKFERQREKELQKMEKTQQKIDKEREKLGRMKKRLEQIETMSEAEVQGLSQEFAQRLREWEMKKGLLSERDENRGDGSAVGTGSPKLDSPRITHSRSYTVKHSRSNSAKQYKEKPERERTQSMGQDSLERYCQPSPDLNSHRGSPTRSSSVPLFPLAAVEGKDECTSIDLSLTDGLHMSGVDREKPLLDELARREEDIAVMQHEMEQLTDRINAMSQEHAVQIEHYKRELWATSRRGHYTIESDLIHASLKELQGHLEKLQSTQQQAESDNAQLQAMLAQEVEAKMAAERHIIEKIGTSKEKNGEQTSTKETFERLCEFIRKLHLQLGELKLGVGERDSVLGILQEQLICQELNNRLLEVDLQRRHMEIAYLRDGHNRGTIRRTKTFDGLDHIQRGECAIFGATHGCVKASAHRLPSLEDPSDRLQYCKGPTEELSLGWLDEIVSHKHLFKEPAQVESHVTQTEPAEWNADTAVQTTMSLCGKPTLGPVTTPTTDQDSGGSTPIANGPAGAFPMPNPVKPVRVRHIGFGSADAPSKSDKKLKTNLSDDVTYTFAIKPSPEAAKHHMWFKRPVSDGIVMETSHIVGAGPPGREDTHFRPVSHDCSVDDDGTEDYADSPHLPHSPVIRSHNPRKLKSNNKVSQLSADARVWKATPPKRQIRHRKGSTERRPGDQKIYDDDCGVKPVTSNTESFIKPRTNQFVKPAATAGGSADRHKLTLPVQRYNRTPSPNNLTLTPMHRLKSAHELLHESENKRLSLIQNQDMSSPDSSVCSASFDIVVVSDKENSSGVIQARKQSSRDNSPDKSPWVRQSSPTGNNVRLAVRRLSSPSREQVKPPLKDLTNDSRKLKQIKNDLIGRSSPERTVNVSAGTKISERPKGGTVSQRMEIFENKSLHSDIGKLSTSKQSLSTSKQSLSTSKQSLSASKQSLSTSKQSLSASKQSLATSKQSLSSSRQSLQEEHSPGRDRKDSKSSHKSSDAKSSSSVESTVNPSPASKERKVHRLFSRKYASQSAAVPAEGEGDGAVRALCRQAVSIELPDREDEPDQASGAKQGEGQEKKKGFPWLHKPKKFFKASNDGMLQVEISDFEARIGC